MQDDVAVPDVTPVEEGFGSDLTGVTDSDEVVKESGETNPSPENAEMESQRVSEALGERISLPAKEVSEDAADISDSGNIPPLPSFDVASPSIDGAPHEQDPEVMETYADVLTPQRETSILAEELPADEQTDGSVVDVDVNADAESPKEEESDRVASPPVRSTSRRQEGESLAADIYHRVDNYAQGNARRPRLPTSLSATRKEPEKNRNLWMKTNQACETFSVALIISYDACS